MANTIPFLISLLENLSKQNNLPSISIQMTSITTSAQLHDSIYLKSIQESLIFYFRDQDNELFIITLKGPRYNEYAIFISYDKWQSSSWLSFYSHLKTLKFYQTLLQEFHGHPVLVVIPTGYIQTLRFPKYYLKTNYWIPLDDRILQFIHQVFPDAHICPADEYWFYSNQHPPSSPTSPLDSTTLAYPPPFPAPCIQNHQCTVLQEYSNLYDP